MSHLSPAFFLPLPSLYLIFSIKCTLFLSAGITVTCWIRSWADMTSFREGCLLANFAKRLVRAGKKCCDDRTESLTQLILMNSQKHWERFRECYEDPIFQPILEYIEDEWPHDILERFRYIHTCQLDLNPTEIDTHISNRKSSLAPEPGRISRYYPIWCKRR
jgi:hypothetical protein